MENNSSFQSTLNHINHYQKKLDKYAMMGETEKLLCCIHKLKYLPVTVNHLEVTGVGKSINALRHKTGIIGDKARALVHKWKLMVAEEEQEEQQRAEEEEEQQRNHNRKQETNASYSNASPANLETNEEEYDPSDEGDRLQIQEDQGEEVVENVPYNPGGEPIVEEDENCNGYNPRTSREDYLSIGAKEVPSSYQPSGYEDAEQSNPESPDISILPNGDSHTTSKDGDKLPKTKHDSKHKKRKHKSSKHEEKRKKSGDTSSTSSNSKHKSSSKDKRRDKEKEKESSRHKSHSSNKSRHKEKEVEYKHSTPPPPPSVDISSPNYVTSNSSEKKRSRESSGDEKKRSRESSGDEKKRSRESSGDGGEGSGGVGGGSEVAAPKKKDHSSRPSKDKENNHKEKHKRRSHHKSDKSDDREDEAKASKRKRGEAESSSGFEAALMGMDNPNNKKKKKKKSKDREKEEEEPESVSGSSKHSKSKSCEPAAPPKQFNLNTDYGRDQLPELPSTFEDDVEPPQLMTSYKPLPHLIQRQTQHKDPFTNQMTDEEALSYMLSSKNKNSKQRRIYEGKTLGLSTVPTLFNSCIRVLQENIDALEITGGIPFDLLQPVLEKASPDQLFSLENYNPYILEDTDILWSAHCRKFFKTHKKEDMESWRDLFIRSTDENQERMRIVTENLQKKYVTKAAPKRKTIIAYVNVAAKPPKSVARAQARYGTANTSPVKSVGLHRGGAGTSNSSSTSSSSASTVSTVSNNNHPAPRPDRPFPKSTVKKPKVAPLMGKARQLMKQVCRR